MPLYTIELEKEVEQFNENKGKNLYFITIGEEKRIYLTLVDKELNPKKVRFIDVTELAREFCKNYSIKLNSNKNNIEEIIEEILKSKNGYVFYREIMDFIKDNIFIATYKDKSIVFINHIGIFDDEGKLLLKADKSDLVLPTKDPNIVCIIKHENFDEMIKCIELVKNSDKEVFFNINNSIIYFDLGNKEVKKIEKVSKLVEMSRKMFFDDSIYPEKIYAAYPYFLPEDSSIDNTVKLIKTEEIKSGSFCIFEAREELLFTLDFAKFLLKKKLLDEYGVKFKDLRKYDEQTYLLEMSTKNFDSIVSNTSFLKDISSYFKHLNCKYAVAFITENSESDLTDKRKLFILFNLEKNEVNLIRSDGSISFNYFTILDDLLKLNLKVKEHGDIYIPIIDLKNNKMILTENSDKLRHSNLNIKTVKIGESEINNFVQTL